MRRLTSPSRYRLLVVLLAVSLGPNPRSGNCSSRFFRDMSPRQKLADDRTFDPMPEVHWQTQYAAARTEATKTKRALFVLFYDIECQWSQKFAKSMQESRSLAKLLNTRFVCVALDVDSHPLLVQVLEIASVPEVIIANHDGKILRYMEGFHDADEVEQRLRADLQKLDKLERAMHRKCAVGATKAP